MKPIFSLFPKFYSHLDVHQLAGLVREVGLDTTNLVIREGYWVSLPGIAKELPRFVKAMGAEGLEIRYATAGLAPEDVIADPSPLGVMAENGITEFRLGYFGAGEDVAARLEQARGAMERIVSLCERYGIRAVYQIHHGTLIPSASAAWTLIGGLPSKWVGIKIDPGNQGFEGYEDWNRTASLLGEYITAVGVKDTALAQDRSRIHEPDKGWRRLWATIDEGVANWHEVAAALEKIEFDGTFVFMPFYDENDPVAMTAKLKREVAYLRGVVSATCRR